MLQLKFPSHESGDKPYPVEIGSKVKKLKGKAVSNWVHIRNWPLIIKNLVSNFDDPVVSLGLLLHEIVERLTAHEYFWYETIIVEEKIVQYLDMRKSIRLDYPNKMHNPNQRFCSRLST